MSKLAELMNEVSVKPFFGDLSDCFFVVREDIDKNGVKSTRKVKPSKEMEKRTHELQRLANLASYKMQVASGEFDANGELVPLYVNEQAWAKSSVAMVGDMSGVESVF